MSICIHPSLGSRFTAILHSYAQDDGLPFASALTEDDIQRAAVAEGVAFASADDDVYTPAITLWGFIGQVLSGRKACIAAVARIIVLRIAMGLPPCSTATGAYCKARAKLPEPFLRRLTYQVGSEIEDQAPAHWRWHNRRALLVDGTTCTLPDTPENQAAYPQSRAQRRGLGFPMIRLVVLLTLATATIVGCAFGPYKGKETGETALLRELFDQLRRGDVVVADRYHCSYFMIALLLQHGVDVAFRLHHLRHYDFRRGRRLGPGDHIVEWQLPQRRTWTNRATYATMSATLTVRELRFNVDNPGFRTREIIVATIPARRDSMTALTAKRTSPTCIIGVGTRNSIYARSSGRWAWSGSLAKRQRWCARNYGRISWVTIWRGKWRRRRHGNAACARGKSASRGRCKPWRRSRRC